MVLSHTRYHHDKTSKVKCINNSGVAAPIIRHMSAISGLVSGSVSIYGGSTQSMSVTETSYEHLHDSHRI